MKWKADCRVNMLTQEVVEWNDESSCSDSLWNAFLSGDMDFAKEGEFMWVFVDYDDGEGE